MSSLLKNTSFMLFGSVGQKIISLAYFSFLVRNLGANLIGEYTAALALSTLFVVFIDLGLTNLLIRTGAQNQAALSQTVSTIFKIKAVTGGLAYLALIIFCRLNFENSFLTLVSVSGVTMILDTIHLTFYGYLRAKGKLHYEAIGMIMSQFITLLLGTGFIYLDLPLVSLILAFSIASATNVLYSYYQARRNGFIFIQPEKFSKIKVVLWSVLPFSLAIIFGRFYSYLDVVLLKIISNSVEVGIYSTPSKISFAFQFIPLAFTAALYPRLSELARTDIGQFKDLLTKSIQYLLLISVPISLGIFLLAEPIVIFAFSSVFLSSVLPLKILILSLIGSFVSFALGSALNACGAEKKQTAIVGVALLGNLVANLFLIPALGASGAAWSALIGNCILGLAGFFFLPTQFKPDFKMIIIYIFKISLAGIFMCLTIKGLENNLPYFLWRGMIGALVFTASAWLLKLVSITDILIIKKNFFRRAL